MITGFTGPSGSVGDSGAAGIQGSPGLRGSSGAAGPPGSAGSTGIPGSGGLIGNTGMQGRDGNQGFTGQSGTGLPGENIGQNKLYLNSNVPSLLHLLSFNFCAFTYAYCKLILYIVYFITVGIFFFLYY